MEKKIGSIVRYLLALLLFVFGLNKYLGFISMPPPENEVSQAFMGGLGATGYYFKMLGAIYIGVGILLLLNYAVSFGLVILAPINFNILLYHFTMGEAQTGLFGVIFAILVAIMAWMRRHTFRPLFEKG